MFDDELCFESMKYTRRNGHFYWWVKNLTLQYYEMQHTNFYSFVVTFIQSWELDIWIQMCVTEGYLQSELITIFQTDPIIMESTKSGITHGNSCVWICCDLISSDSLIKHVTLVGKDKLRALPARFVF
jgi:hypothetical protein